MPPVPDDEDGDCTPRGVTPDSMGSVVLHSEQSSMSAGSRAHDFDDLESSQGRNSMLEWVKDVWDKDSRSSMFGKSPSRPSMWKSRSSFTFFARGSQRGSGEPSGLTITDITIEEGVAEPPAPAPAPAPPPDLEDAPAHPPDPRDESSPDPREHQSLALLQVTTMEL